MKVKKKGRVYPSLSSSPSSLVSYKDPNSVLKLLPVAILALASALLPQDQEVLAYMLKRSIISTTNPSTLTHHQPKNKFKKLGKVFPVFQCGCFDCYTRFWHRWDSSPNRDLIDQVIEAFEDHLIQNDEESKKHCKAASRKKDKVIILSICESNVVSVDDALHRDQQSQESEGLAEAENGVGFEQEGEENVGEDVTGNLETDMVAVATGVSHKGLARKVLADVVSLFNSRLWSLWGPSI